MGLYSGGLIIGRILASEIWVDYFRERVFFWGGGSCTLHFIDVFLVFLDFYVVQELRMRRISI